MLLTQIQRRFRARREKRRLQLEEALPRPDESSMPLPLPPRPIPLKKSSDRSTATGSQGKELLLRCQNCGSITSFPTLRMRGLFQSCSLCLCEFSKIEQMSKEGMSITLPPDPERSLDNPIPDFPPQSNSGPEHSLLAEKHRVALRCLCASIGSDKDPSRAIDITNIIQEMIAMESSEGEGAHNCLTLNSGMRLKLFGECAEAERLTHMRLLKSLNPIYLRARWELTEKSGAPFRRWSTKQKVEPVTGIDSDIVIGDKSIFLKPPIEPLLKVLPSSFLGQASNPLLQYPVHEDIQAEIDLDMPTASDESPENSHENLKQRMPEHKDGSFLVIGPSHSTLINQIGDPNPGSEKILRLDIDMQGFQGEIVVRATSGHLHQPIVIGKYDWMIDRLLFMPVLSSPHLNPLITSLLCTSCNHNKHT